VVMEPQVLFIMEITLFCLEEGEFGLFLFHQLALHILFKPR
jgi:hypothetical protein